MVENCLQVHDADHVSGPADWIEHFIPLGTGALNRTYGLDQGRSNPGQPSVKALYFGRGDRRPSDAGVRRPRAIVSDITWAIVDFALSVAGTA